MLPPIIADLRLGDRHDGRSTPPIHAPIIAIAGEFDTIAPPSQMDGWNSATTGKVCVVSLCGGHFLQDSHAVDVLAELMREVETNCELGHR